MQNLSEKKNKWKKLQKHLQCDHLKRATPNKVNQSKR